MCSSFELLSILCKPFFLNRFFVCDKQKSEDNEERKRAIRRFAIIFRLNSVMHAFESIPTLRWDKQIAVVN